MVQRRYSDPAVAASVERKTTCPLNGSCWNMKSKAALSLSSGTFQATSAPEARLVASKVCRTRRIVPAASMARIRSSTPGKRHAAQPGDLLKRLRHEPGDPVFAHRQDARVDGVVMFDGAGAGCRKGVHAGIILQDAAAHTFFHCSILCRSGR